ncbi:MAG TPA: MFS transporter [Beutenbergiaceae bacterium]|nr:MFS transporter [Beutenbergiaceae bacterium]
MSNRWDQPEESAAAGENGTSTLVSLLAVTFLALLNYAALLPVVPLWAASGGAASATVGATTGVMMAATVAAQLAMPWLFTVIGLRTMIACGAVLLGGPTPLYLLSAEILPIMAISVVRGVGFAFIVVAGATLVADVAPPGKLARAVGYYGAAAALPNIGALAGGVWAAQLWGFEVVFTGAAVASLLAAILAVRLPAHSRGTFVLPALEDLGRIAAPIVLFLVTAGAFGAATTFLPVSGPDAGHVSLALLAASVAMVLGRLAAGTIGDRIGAGRLLTSWVLSVATGSALIAWALDGPVWLLILGAALLGGGFGACQNDSLVATIQRLGAGRSGTASTIWNIGFDGGVGLGAVVLGWVIAGLGYAGAFFALAIGIATVTVLSMLIVPRGPQPESPRR